MGTDHHYNFGHILQIWNNRCFVTRPSGRLSTSWTTPGASTAMSKSSYRQSSRWRLSRTWRHQCCMRTHQHLQRAARHDGPPYFLKEKVKAAEAALKETVPPVIWYAFHWACSILAEGHTNSGHRRHTSAQLEDKILRNRLAINDPHTINLLLFACQA